MPDNTSFTFEQHPETKPSKPAEMLAYFIAPALLCLFVYVLWPFLQYCIDSDSISYMNIVHNYLKADYEHAINGFWSPMGCWLTVLVIKATHWQTFGATIFVNTIGASLLTLANQFLFHKFRSNNLERLSFAILSAVFWTYAIYFQPFTDLWQYFFLTLGLLILLNKNYLSKWYLWILLGLIGALAFFSKAYSFYFFPLMVFIATCFHLKEAGAFNWKKLITVCFFIGITMFVLAFPWLYLIHDKYHIWTSSTTGALNASWFLIGYQEFRPGINIIIPPPYKGALFYFEDPFLAQGRTVHVYDSFRFIFKQIARIGYNCFNWVKVTSGISPFFIVTWIVTFLLAFKKTNQKHTSLKIIAGILLVYPLPFFLFTFETGRYIWFLMCIGSILGLYYATPLLERYVGKKSRNAFIILFFFSFAVTPVLELKGMLHQGEKEHTMAVSLNKMGIKGSFISNLSYEDASISMIRLAWLSQNAWYCHTQSLYSTKALFQDAKRYHVKYYFYFYTGTGDDYTATALDGKPLQDITNNKIPGLKVFQLEE